MKTTMKTQIDYTVQGLCIEAEDFKDSVFLDLLNERCRRKVNIIPTFAKYGGHHYLYLDFEEVADETKKL